MTRPHAAQVAEYYCMDREVEQWTSQEDMDTDRRPITIYRTARSVSLSIHRRRQLRRRPAQSCRVRSG